MTLVLLAHAGSAMGPNVEALILAAALIVLGIALFVQKSTKPVVSVVLVVAGIAVAAGGFTFLAANDDHGEAEAAGAVDQLSAEALRGLCDAREDLEEGDIASASAAFFDRSHGSLHDIADRVGDRDRAAAADLLEAKQAVESGFEAIEMRGGQPKLSSLDGLQRDLDRLIIAAVVGMSELGVEVTGCE